MLIENRVSYFRDLQICGKYNKNDKTLQAKCRIFIPLREIK